MSAAGVRIRRLPACERPPASEIAVFGCVCVCLCAWNSVCILSQVQWEVLQGIQ